MGATKIAAGVYNYRGVRVEREDSSELHLGWWAIYDLDDVLMEREFYPTKRAAMDAIDADPPAGH